MSLCFRCFALVSEKLGQCIASAGAGLLGGIIQ